ncbi:hypothetical protein [Texcoconibacillus texcoconensis]|uniref:Uncharacterized protein n=1 Tax=Texcoconibacillus texcoconensis TaxID=1095777 RepID=A0A840QU02_9BACI|nr:hypothetical protein [Texcoconibacillus texcoconensis]MBB5174865.1 hypothetical protein [Texcoconibacillus texcoconensis]
MGYIPPVRDNQLTIYHHRQPEQNPVIRPSPAVYKLEFFDAIKDHYRGKKPIYHSDVKSINQLKETRKIENEWEGKGKYIDELA